MITKIKTVAIYVGDQKVAVEFYTKVLGFEIKRNESMGSKGSWIELIPPGAETHVVLYPRALMPKWEDHKPSIVYQCDNMETTYQELVEKGVKFKEPPEKMHWGDFAIFYDPDGNEFVLTA